MSGFRTNRRVQIDESETANYDAVEEDDNLTRLRSSGDSYEDQEPFMGMKVRRKASLNCYYKGDYLDVPVHPYLMKILHKQALAAVEKMCLSELSDNFFAIIVPSEYDLLMASTRKTEIVTVLVEATKGASDELEVAFSNSFEYHAAGELVKEVQFEQVEGGVKTRILRK